MTIGPAPMIMMDWMSVRLGMRSQSGGWIDSSRRAAATPAGVSSRCQWHCSAPSGRRIGSRIRPSRRHAGDRVAERCVGDRLASHCGESLEPCIDVWFVDPYAGTRSINSRSRISISRPPFDHFDEPMEQIMAVARPGLASGWYCTLKTPAGRCRPDPRSSRRTATHASRVTVAGRVFGSTAKPWFWLVISTLPVARSLHRLVGAAMAAIQLVGLRPQRQRQQLMAEADAEHRHACGQHALDRRHRILPGRRRIARAVRQEHAVRLDGAGCRRPVAVAGTTVTRQPAEARQRRMLRLAP